MESAVQRTALVPQPHGGAIWSAGTPNPVAGSGRPRDLWRQRCEEVVNNSRALTVLGKIISGDIYEQLNKGRGEPIYGETKNRDRIAAFEVLMRYVLPKEETEPRAPSLGTQAEALAWMHDALPELLRKLYPGYELRPIEAPSEDNPVLREDSQ